MIFSPVSGSILDCRAANFQFIAVIVPRVPISFSSTIPPPFAVTTTCCLANKSLTIIAPTEGGTEYTAQNAQPASFTIEHAYDLPCCTLDSLIVRAANSPLALHFQTSTSRTAVFKLSTT